VLLLSLNLDSSGREEDVNDASTVTVKGAGTMSAERLESYTAGDIIFREREPGNVMYMVHSGQVELRLGGLRLEIVGEGEFFGEMALIDEEPRSARAIALSDCELQAVDRERFEFMVQQTPSFALRVMRTLAQSLRRMNEV
jgi:CRP/FNR family cyclic AMP-dependent transcriptional regulator